MALASSALGDGASVAGDGQSGPTKSASHRGDGAVLRQAAAEAAGQLAS